MVQHGDHARLGAAVMYLPQVVVFLSLASAFTFASQSPATPVLIDSDAGGLQTVLAEYPYVGDGVFGETASGIRKTAKTVVDEVGGEAVFGAGQKIEQWMEDGREFIRQHDHTCAYQS